MFAHRSSPVAAACGLLGLALLSTSAAAEGSPSDAVVITATRQPLKADAVLSDVTVLSREDLERAGPRTLAEVLGHEPGIQFLANGGLGKSSSVFIRGLEARHTLVLIDGIRYGSATLGQAAFENLPLEVIERIEIVRGPLSSLYGSEAAGGVIQIFTRPGREGVHPNASVGVGSAGYRAASAGASGGSGPWSGSVQLQHQQNTGFSSTNAQAPWNNFHPDDDGFRQNAASVQAAYRFNDAWRLSVHALGSEGRSQIDDGPAEDSLAALKSEAYGADLVGKPLAGWTTTLRASRSTDSYETVRTDYANSYTDLGTIRTVQQQLSWENSVATPAGDLLVLAERLRQNVTKPADPYEVTSRTIHALALGLNGRAGAHTWQASARHDRNSQYGHQNTGALAYGFQFAPAWRVGAAYGTSFVAPSFNQLYWPQYGNPSLVPEKGRHAELNARFEQDGHRVNLVAYQNRMENCFISGPQLQQVKTCRSDGTTLSYEGEFSGARLSASVDHTNPRNATAGNADDGKQLARRAKNTLKARAEADRGPVTAGITMLAVGERFDDAANTTRLGGFVTADLHADWRFLPDWTLQARLNNIADKRYETVQGYTQPGRELYVTLRWAPR